MRDASCGRVFPIARAARIAVAAIALSSCGGGGDGSNPTSPPQPTPDQAHLAIAQKLYDGTARTPAGFFADPPPANVTGVVATVHVKNTDVTPAAGGQPRYELCTDDETEAMAWSESNSTWMSSYADLVQVDSDARRFEFERVPRSDPTALLRQRVFRCSYLDRSATDLASESGPAGMLKPRPLTASELRDLAEYLWRFTPFNNADYVVEASVGTASGTALTHRIEMWRLQPAAIAGDCDVVQAVNWIHTLDTTSGALSRSVERLGSFRARRSQGLVSLCD